MATELQTKLTESISLADLKKSSEDILNTLVNGEDYLRIEMDVDQMNIDVNSNLVIIANEKDHPEEIVELTFTYQSPVPGYEDPEEDGWWVSATIRASNDSQFKYYLALAFIICLSSINGQNIIDESCFWSNKRKQTLNEFRKVIGLS